VVWARLAGSILQNFKSWLTYGVNALTIVVIGYLIIRTAATSSTSCVNLIEFTVWHFAFSLIDAHCQVIITSLAGCIFHYYLAFCTRRLVASELIVSWKFVGWACRTSSQFCNVFISILTVRVFTQAVAVDH